jgi:hypothetical protein
MAAGNTVTTLRKLWSPLRARVRQWRGRPLLVHLRTLLDRIPFKPFDINVLYFLEHAGIPALHANFLRGRAEVRRGTVEDLDGLTKCQNSRREFLNRFRSQDHCAVAVVDGRIVGYQWFCHRPVYSEERYAYEIAIPPDAVYEYDIFILPEYRLAGLWFKFHCVYLRELLHGLQRQRIIGMVDYGNRLSMNTHLRFGFKLVRVVCVVKIFGKAFCLRESRPGEEIRVPRWVSFADRADARGAEGRRAFLAAAGAGSAEPAGAAHTTSAVGPN